MSANLFTVTMLIFSLFLNTLSEVCDQFNWVIHSFCLMTNHYHLVVETADANHSKGMRQLNGVDTVRFNRKKTGVRSFFVHSFCRIKNGRKPLSQCLPYKRQCICTKKDLTPYFLSATDDLAKTGGKSCIVHTLLRQFVKTSLTTSQSFSVVFCV